jgi:hypothetical protein
VRERSRATVVSRMIAHEKALSTCPTGGSRVPILRQEAVSTTARPTISVMSATVGGRVSLPTTEASRAPTPSTAARSALFQRSKASCRAANEMRKPIQV